MKHNFLISLLALLTLSSFSYADKGKDLFNLDALDFYSPDSTNSRLDVYVEFPFDRLEFAHSKVKDDIYSSNVDLTVEISNVQGTEVVHKLYKEEITTPITQIQYLNQSAKILTKNFFLVPGSYKLKVTAFEQGTKKSSTVDKEITIRDFTSDSITISDVMILSKYQVDNNKKSITPNISRNVLELDTFYIFYFVYKNSDDARIDINCNVFDSKKALIYNTSNFIDESNGLESHNQVFMKMPLPNLSFDNYSIEITAISSKYTTTATSGFVCMSNYFPANLTNMDMLISQLQYVANEKEMKYIKDGKTLQEKQKRFLEFWRSKDPSPGTKKNELMAEYYIRLDYATKHFSTPYAEGWKSDMGMVYIIFGMPSNVDRHPSEMNSKPYEVWDYYSMNREFVFVDETGFGDYRLITPIYDDLRFKIH